MPFPKKEIETAYEEALSFVAGDFKEDPDMLEAYSGQTLIGTKIVEQLDETQKAEFRSFLTMTQIVQEYERRHYFAEGWRMAREQMKGKNGAEG